MPNKKIKSLNYYREKKQTIIEKIAIKDINYIKAIGSSSTIITNKATTKTLQNIEQLEKKLDKKTFVKCNEENIINLKKINEIGYYYVKIKNHKITITEDRFNTVTTKLKSLLDIY